VDDVKGVLTRPFLPLTQQFYTKLESIILSNCTIGGHSWLTYQKKKKTGGPFPSFLSYHAFLTFSLHAEQNSLRRSLSMMSFTNAC
jgi:hypothetical protein